MCFSWLTPTVVQIKLYVEVSPTVYRDFQDYVVSRISTETVETYGEENGVTLLGHQHETNGTSNYMKIKLRKWLSLSLGTSNSISSW